MNETCETCIHWNWLDEICEINEVMTFAEDSCNCWDKEKDE